MNRLLFILLLLPVFATQKVNAQGWQWAISANDSIHSNGSSITTDIHGNVYLLTGADTTITFGSATISNSDTLNTVLIKFDSSGNSIWARSIKGLDDFGGQVKLITDILGNIYVAGPFGYNITLGGIILNNTGGLAGNNAFLAKYNSAGALIWAKNLDGGGWNVSIPSVSVDSIGNVYLTGNYVGYGNLTSDTVTLHFDDDVLGTMFLLKFDSLGNTIWGRQANSGSAVTGGVTDASGNTYIAGGFDYSSLSFGTSTFYNTSPIDTALAWDMFLIKYNNAGNIMWVRIAGGDSATRTDAYSISKDLYENIYLAGYFTPDSVMFGTITPYNPLSFSRMFLVKYDSSGNAKWVTGNIDNAIAVSSYSATDDSGNIYLTGYDTAYRFYLQKIDSLGSSRWIVGASSGNICLPYTIAADPWANVYVSGTFYSTDINFGAIHLVNSIPDSNNQINNYSTDLFLAKLEGRLRDEALVNTPTQCSQQIAIYPNPASNVITISASQKIVNIVIINLYGQIVFTHEYNNNQVQINVAELPSGMYITRVNNTEVRKFVKQ